MRTAITDGEVVVASIQKTQAKRSELNIEVIDKLTEALAIQK
jgi:hypothetical protein